jgi:HAD superfamily hydrolase (TIGR01549 family)
MTLPVDNAWLAEFENLLSTSDVITFDVFDTAISRRVETPVDVFALTETALVVRYGETCRKFAEARELAEAQARPVAAARGYEDIRFEDIYAILQQRKKLPDADLRELMEFELRAEESVLFGVPEILEAVRLARAKGKKVYFISDMYLSGADIGAFLKLCGYPDDIEVLSSSDTRRTKAAGGQWTLLKKRLAPNERVLHVGDDKHSDVLMPRKHGLSTLLFDRYRSDRRRMGALVPEVLPFSFRVREVRLGLRDKSDPSSFMRAFGSSFGALVVGGFVNWLEERCKSLNIERLFFLSRDGFLLQRVWDAAGCGSRTGIESSYLHLSRRTLYLANASSDQERGTLKKATLDLLSGESHLSVQRLIERASLGQCRDLVAEATAVFGNLGAPLGEGRKEEFHRILQKYRNEVIEALAPVQCATLGYLKQEGLDQRRIGIVDMGWHGSMQSAICDLVSLFGQNASVTGFYYGLWSTAQRNRPKAGWMEGAFANDFHSPEECEGLRNGVAVLENLHCSSEGTTIGYELKNGRYAPVTQQTSVEAQQFDEIVRPFQEGVIAEITKAASKNSGNPLLGLSLHYGAEAIRRVFMSPTEEETKYLGSILHSPSFDHGAFGPILTKVTQGRVREALASTSLWESEWPFAYYLDCIACCRSPDERSFVDNHFRPMFDRLDQRSLRAIR